MQANLLWHVLSAAHDRVARHLVAVEQGVRLWRCEPAAAQQTDRAIAQSRAEEPVELAFGRREHGSEVNLLKRFARGAGVAVDETRRGEYAADERGEQRHFAHEPHHLGLLLRLRDRRVDAGEHEQQHVRGEEPALHRVLEAIGVRLRAAVVPPRHDEDEDRGGGD